MQIALIMLSVKNGNQQRRKTPGKKIMRLTVTLPVGLYNKVKAV
jgi:hypothetical protein